MEKRAQELPLMDSSEYKAYLPQAWRLEFLAMLIPNFQELISSG